MDLAFAIDTFTGKHFDYATINIVIVKYRSNTKLSEKNCYTIQTSIVVKTNYSIVK